MQQYAEPLVRFKNVKEIEEFLDPSEAFFRTPRVRGLVEEINTDNGG